MLNWCVQIYESDGAPRVTRGDVHRLGVSGRF